MWVVQIWKTSIWRGVYSAASRKETQRLTRSLIPLQTRGITFPSDDLSFPEKKILTLDLDPEHIQVRVWKWQFWAPLWSFRDPKQVKRLNFDQTIIYSYSFIFKKSLYKCIIVTLNRLVDKVNNQLLAVAFLLCSRANNREKLTVSQGFILLASWT